jgi:hypothetical protein
MIYAKIEAADICHNHTKIDALACIGSKKMPNVSSSFEG